MRTLINSTYISLDGVIQDPQDWPSLPAGDGRGTQLQTDLLLRCNAQIMGRKTYEGFAAVWPGRTGDPYSDHINAMPKYVFSSQITDPTWENTTVVAGDAVQAVRELKRADGGDIVQYGFGHLAYELMQHGLIDELRLWVHPFFVGAGGPEALLYRASAPVSLELADTVPLQSGIVVLTYRAAVPG